MIGSAIDVPSMDCGQPTTLHGFTVDGVPGLAVTLSIEASRLGRWEITHIQSGTKLPCGGYKTASKAARKALQIAGVADWTGDAESLNAIGGLRDRVIGVLL